jgi:hypothetical protein
VKRGFLWVCMALAIGGCQAILRRAKARCRAAGGGGRAAFFSRGASGDEQPLSARRFSVRVTTAPGTVRSHLVLEVGSADDDPAGGGGAPGDAARGGGHRRHPVGERTAHERRPARAPAATGIYQRSWRAGAIRRW